MGPFLFATYVNDLPETVKSLMFHFADDTKLFQSITCDLDIVQLQADADNFFEWCWLLNINNIKCKCMRIGISNVAPRSYVIDDEPLCSTTVEKVGVVVDQHLKFAAAVATKGNCILGLISKYFEHLDVNSLSILYKTLVHPVLEYVGTTLHFRSESVRKSSEESHQTCTIFE